MHTGTTGAGPSLESKLPLNDLEAFLVKAPIPEESVLGLEPP